MEEPEDNPVFEEIIVWEELLRAFADYTLARWFARYSEEVSMEKMAESETFRRLMDAEEAWERLTSFRNDRR